MNVLPFNGHSFMCKAMFLLQVNILFRQKVTWGSADGGEVTAGVEEAVSVLHTEITRVRNH